MPRRHPASLALDYREAATPDVLENLSGVAATGAYLWTVSDEGRSLECLRLEDGAYGLHRQYALDDLVGDLPGRRSGDELDLESIDIADGVLWLCGSHCRVREDGKDPGRLGHRIRGRRSRRLLAAIALDDDGGTPGEIRHVPFSGKGSLRRLLADDDYLKPFLALPSKENGLDIEGVAVLGETVLLGLRGPVLDSMAVVIRLTVSRSLRARAYALAFLDLGGLAIRDLARRGDRVLVLAGTTADVAGPYRLYEWTPEPGDTVQRPRLLFSWLTTAAKPEGIAMLPGVGEETAVVVYDAPFAGEGTVYLADRLTGF